MKEIKTIKLTKSKIDKIAFSDKEIFIHDSELKGFALRVGKTKLTYYVYTKLDGKPIKKPIGDVNKLSPDDARKIAKEMLGKIASGINICEEAKKKKIETVTLHDAFNEYVSIKKLKYRLYH